MEPGPLRAIREAVERHRPAPSNLGALRPNWEAHVARARAIPGVRVEDSGETIALGELSPGCRACKEGAWDCIFVTMRCNLDCAFCFSPHAVPQDYSGSGFGTGPAEIAAAYARTTIAGIGFTGGEPFLETERLLEWVGYFKSRFPDRYAWVYTNGLLAEPQVLRRLGALGLDEVRFNLAATGYDHPIVLEHVAAAAGCIPRVAVEIPAIPEHADRLIGCLPGWADRGVRFLNLHELLCEPGTNAAGLPGPRQEVVLPDGHRTAVHPGSRALALAVMERVQAAGLPLSVNDCSLQNKLRQLRGRRRCLAPLVQRPYERFVGEVLESYCAYDGDGDCHFFHPEALAEMRQRYPGYRFARLARAAPLAVGEQERWVEFEEANG